MISMAEMKIDAATLAQEAGNFERISGDLKTRSTRWSRRLGIRCRASGAARRRQPPGRSGALQEAANEAGTRRISTNIQIRPASILERADGAAAELSSQMKLRPR